MSLLDALRVGEIKKELETSRAEFQAFKESVAAIGGMDFVQVRAIVDQLRSEESALRANAPILATAVELTQAVDQLKSQEAALRGQIPVLTTGVEISQVVERLSRDKADLLKQVDTLDAVIAQKSREIVQLDDEITLESFGFYKPRLELKSSEEYKARLDKNREAQVAMVKSGTAAVGGHDWSVNGSKKEGARLTKDFMQLILRSFNNECDVCTAGVTFHNIESMKKRIGKAFDTLNKLGKTVNVVLSARYLDLKLIELDVCYGYQAKKQEEREEQKRIREQMREEAKLAREIEEAKAKIEKEKKHFLKALDDVTKQLAAAESEDDRVALQGKQAEIEQKLGGIAKDERDVLNREQNTRAGYVYVISNIGSFGENVYKIGVTRRLDPTERIDELGDASVPFAFDIHATIFSDDSPALESALHRAFADRRLNMVNGRKEFFRVTLDEIEEVVRRYFTKAVEFTRLAEAPQYRESITQRENRFASDATIAAPSVSLN